MNSFLRNLSLLPGESLAACRNAVLFRRSLLLALGLGLVVTSPLAAFLEVARGELILNTVFRTGYDSNLFARADAEDDWFVSLTPELQFLRQAGKGTISARTGVNFTRFMSQGEEDFEDFYASLEVTYPVHPHSPLSGGVFVDYTQLSGAIDLVNTRVRTETFAVGADTLYRVSQRLGLRNSLAYEHVTVERFSNIEVYRAVFGLQWVYSEKLSFFSDYQLRRATSSGDNPFDDEAVDNLDHALLLGATGTLRPRIEGTASLGFQQTDARGAESDRGLLVAAADLDWAWRPRTSLNLSVLRDINISPTAETVEASQLSLGAEHEVDPKISLTGTLGYRHFDFRGRNPRRDYAFLGGLGLRYLFTRYWNAGFDYEFIFNHSNMPEADYSRHLVQLFTRYSF